MANWEMRLEVMDDGVGGVNLLEENAPRDVKLLFVTCDCTNVDNNDDCEGAPRELDPFIGKPSLLCSTVTC
jgi:hypothetical protein